MIYHCFKMSMMVNDGQSMMVNSWSWWLMMMVGLHSVSCVIQPVFQDCHGSPPWMLGIPHKVLGQHGDRTTSSGYTRCSLYFQQPRYWNGSQPQTAQNWVVHILTGLLRGQLDSFIRGMFTRPGAAISHQSLTNPWFNTTVYGTSITAANFFLSH